LAGAGLLKGHQNGELPGETFSQNMYSGKTQHRTHTHTLTAFSLVYLPRKFAFHSRPPGKCKKKNTQGKTHLSGCLCFFSAAKYAAATKLCHSIIQLSNCYSTRFCSPLTLASKILFKICIGIAQTHES